MMLLGFAPPLVVTALLRDCVQEDSASDAEQGCVGAAERVDRHLGSEVEGILCADVDVVKANATLASVSF